MTGIESKSKNKATVGKKESEYLTIGQAAKFCDYSPADLGDGAKQKKLKTIKKGSNLLTTRVWLDEYLAQSKKYDDLTAAPKIKVSEYIADEIARELI